MKRRKKTILFFCLIIQVVYCRNDLVSDRYRIHRNKRLTTVFNTVITSSKLRCMKECSVKDSCLAVNVIGNHDIMCELTRGLRNASEMQDDSLSDVFVQDYNKCVEEPGFCLNGATCEQTWTSARCHCADRYQGDRCDHCPARFQGDGCQECSPRFQGDECQQCTQNYYGDDCEVSFTSHSGKKCQGTFLSFKPYDNSGYYDNCKEWCVARSDCGGFTISGGDCILKTCDSLESSGHTTFLKTIP